VDVIFQMEVDIAQRRPPTPDTVLTANTLVAVPDRPSWLAMESEARTLAALMATHWGAMVVAVRIVRAEW
jgi:hypothetical protein